MCVCHVRNSLWNGRELILQRASMTSSCRTTMTQCSVWCRQQRPRGWATTSGRTSWLFSVLIITVCARELQRKARILLTLQFCLVFLRSNRDCVFTSNTKELVGSLSLALSLSFSSCCLALAGILQKVKQHCIARHHVTEGGNIQQADSTTNDDKWTTRFSQIAYKHPLTIWCHDINDRGNGALKMLKVKFMKEARLV